MPPFMPSHHHGAPRRLAALGLATALAVLAAACATPQTPPPPTQEISAATAAIVHAAGSGGDELAPQYMQMARSKLQRAQAANSARSHPAALALAAEARVDAQLAEARAEAIKARQNADAAREGNRVLREEIQRKKP